MNVSQLKGVTTALGGGAQVNPDGTINAPSYTVTNADGSTSTVRNVGDALANLDGRTAQNTTNLTNLTTNINNGTVGLVQQAAAGANLTVGKSTDGTAVDFAGTAGARKLLNVADGTVASGSKDAVNGSQLFATNQQVAQNTSDIAGNTTSINNLDGRVTNVEGDVSSLTTNINNGTVGLVQQAGAGANLTVGKDTDGAAVDFAGTTGARKLINVADGTVASGSKDAVNGGQLFGVSQSVANAMGGGSTVNSDGSISAPSYAVTNLDGSTTTVNNVGDAISNLDGRTTQNTTDIYSLNTTVSNMSGVMADAVTYDSAAHDKVTFGNAGTPVQLTNVKAGELSADSSDAVNGSQLFATNQQVGQNTSDIAGNTTSINNLDGRVTNVEGDVSSLTTNINNGTIGLVQQAGAGANLTVGKDTDGAAVDFAGTAGARKLLNVADGTVASGSKDAVNGGQLFGVSQSVANAMGGGSTVNSDGSISAPSYAVTNLDGSTNTVNNVGDAISNLDGRTTQNTTDINSLNTTVSNMSGVMADAVTYDSAAHDKVTFGNAGTPVQLTNVKAGELSADSSDAVNGSQLFATNQQVGQNTADIAGNTTSINNLDGRVTNVEGDVSSLTTNINNGTVGLVQQAGAGANLTVGKDTDGAAVDFAGTAGARKLINVADGTVASGSKDAVNGGQLFGVSQSVANAMGGGSTVNSDGSISAPSYAVTNLDGSTNTVNNVGDAISNLDGRTTQNTTDINSLNTTVSNMSGVMADAVTYDSVAHDKVTFGNAGTPVQLTNVKAGELSADSSDAVNGSQLFATNQQVGQNTTDINTLTNNINNGSVGLVQQSAAGANLTVGKDTDGAAVDFAGTAGARKLLNVADGTVASGSKDAVNGGQLFGVSQSVANAMGGGSTVNSDGSISAPSYAVTNLDGSTTTVNNVGDAISNLDGRTTQNTTDINSLTNNINNGSVGLVQQSAAGANLTVGKDTDGAAVDFAGTAGARKLINVADGTVASGSKDAVNGGQLFGVSQSVANAMGGGSTVNSDGSISAPSYSVTNLDGSTTTVSNVGDAITNLDGRTTQNTTDINSINTSITNMGDSLADAVKYDSSAHDKVTFGNTGTPVQLTNVKAGALSADSSDAVNGSQLFATNQQVGQNTTDISTLTNNINNGSVGLVQQSAPGANLTVGKDTDGAAVDFAGTAGARKLINVADGTVATGSKDAVNGGQLFGVSQSVATAMGGGSIVNPDGSISAPSYSVTNLDGSTTTVSNVGDAISNLDGRTTQNTTDINSINTAITNMTGVMGDAVMYDSAAHDKVTFGNAGTPVQLTNVKAGALTADSTDAVTGAQLFATNNQVSIIDGRVTNLEGSVTNIVNGGGIKYFHTSSSKADSVASGADAVAIGGGAQAGGSGSVALGDNAQATGNGNVALGQNSSDAGRGAEAPYVGKYSGANNDNVVGTVSVGNAATGETRTISNVADGVADNDAVNVRQLDGAVAESKSYTDSKVDGLAGSVSNVVGDVNEVKTRVTTVENNVTNLQNGTDGMAQVNDTSHRGKPKATGTDSVAVGAGAESSGASSTAMGNGARAKGKNSVAIGTDSVATRDNSVAVGSAGNERQITSVAAGTERTDAVNLGQMNDALSDFANQSDSRYNALRKDLHEQDDRLSAGIAGAIAIASLPQPMVNGGSTTSVGIGNFNGQSAVSMGVSHTTNDGKWTAKIGGSVDTQNSFSVGAGVGYNW
ncbi:YadA-like family protein [Pseudomonas sp. PSE14]|uniref:YadA-like family protein n=1 Tax=Pseudomonas sp. PSE14 TaxID=3016341 RepID=UPI0023D8747A|nr:YadA-like family protein [Pseudomonas sp. PSE14]WEJ74300.1 YadA-like family protein [Pseudomonas sp. PSE14]